MKDENADGRLFILHPSSFILRFALLLLLVSAARASALDCPPSPTQWVTDKAGLIDASQAGALNKKLADFEQQSGAQFIIYILPSLEGDPVEDFTVRCAQKWGVGQKKYSNGLVLYVFVKEHKVRIEVGYGLEGTITDAFSSRVERESITPRFRQGDFAGGLNAAADALMAKIRGGEPPVPPLQPRRSAPSGGGVAGSIIPIIIVLILIIFILPLLLRHGGCGGCLWPMLFMGGGGRGMTFGGGGGFSGGGGWGGGGGFSGGGGSFGGGGATGGW